jgi:DNA-directed RNA polymerase beta subunit
MLTTEVAQPKDQTESTTKYPFEKMAIWFEDFELKTPTRSGGQFSASNVMNSDSMDSDKMYPYECRLRSLTYQAPLYATIARRFDNEPEEKVTICLGEVPVMVGSKFCNLHGLDPE